MKTEINPTVVNGVDTTALGQTVAAIQGDAGVAKFEFRARNQLVTGGLNRSEIHQFFGARSEHRTDQQPFVLHNDEPPVLLSEDRAPNPVEYVIQALLGCMTTTTNYKAAAMGLEIESIRSEIAGDLDLRGMLGLDPDVRPGFQELRATLRVKTKGPREPIAELFRSSPVYDTLARPVPIKVNVVFED
jgi:uncharacterized OsmC-like protein